jgi:protein required for attachment to host cells
MHENLIVVANAGKARFFEQPRDGAPLEQIEERVNAAAGLRSQDTESDKLGKQSGSRNGQGASGAGQPSGYSPHQTPAEHHAELFARDVAANLSRLFAAGRFHHVVLIAAPEFLGLLRKVLDANLASIVRLEIDKDYTHMTAPELRERINTQRVRG